MTRTDPSDRGQPPVERRRLRNIAIVLYLAVQVWLPLGYYVGRADPHDDRFAWRMFTDDGARTCRLSVTQDGKAVEIESVLTRGWYGLYRLPTAPRRQLLVELERYLCEKSKTGAASVRLVCEDHERELFVPWDGEPVTCDVAP